VARELRERLTYGKVVASVAVAAGFASLVSPAGALAGTLDQSQPNFSAGSAAFSGQRQLAQTFTAGLSGNLDQVDVHVRRTTIPPLEGTCGDPTGLSAQIRTVTATGTPSDTILATATVPASSVPTAFAWVSITFATPAAVSAGTQYALVLSAPAASCTNGSFMYSWSAGSGNPYPNGAPWVRDPGIGGGNWTPNSGTPQLDHAFKTYVIPQSPPPEQPPPEQPPPEQPPPDGTTPPPTSSQFPRTLSISYSEKKDKFKGRLASQSPACISGQKVKVFEKEKGKDPKLGSVPSLASGKYSLKEKNADGSIYAAVGQSSTSGGTCLAAKSKTIKVG
jgi:hypothetical protein